MAAKGIFAIGTSLALALTVALAANTFARPRHPGQAEHRVAGAPASRSQTPNASSSLKSETRLITVDVSVRDRRGNPVRGLKASDFQIFDDGRGPQEIAAFEFIEPAARPPAPAAANSTPIDKTPAPPPIYSNENFSNLTVPPTAILLDPGNIAFGDQVTARMQALKLIDKMPATTPVAVFQLAHGLTVVQNFTFDRAALRAAVNRSMIPMAQVKNPENDPDNKFNTTDAGAQATQEFQKLEYEEQTTVIANETSDAMRAIAKDLAAYPGQKNLVWISEAFPQWILPGSGFGPHSVEAGDSSSLANPFRQTFQGSANFGDKLRADAQALVDARVTVYPVDARGLVAPGLYDASSNPLATDPVYASNPAIAGPAMGAELTREKTDLVFAQATMEKIAEDTGGQACVNTNDLSGCAKAAIEDGSPDYEISYYRAGVKWDGSFHRITLKTDLHDVKIQYRRGYSATDSVGLAKKQPLEFFRQACASLLPVTSIRLQAEALRAAQPNESRYLLSISPAALSVTSADGKLALHLRVGVCEFAPQGGSFRIYTREFSRKFSAKQAEEWQKQNVQSVIDYKPKRETARLRLAVMDASTGLTGTVDVPAHPQLVYEIRAIGGASETASGAPEKLYSRLQFRSSDGETGGLDLRGDQIEYRGSLSIALSAPAFFHQVFGKTFQCQAGKLVAPDGHSTDVPNMLFAFKNPAGLMAEVDLAGSQPVYTGTLPMDASARAFFERLWKLCHCEQP
jgi:VWFA-related protein